MFFIFRNKKISQNKFVRKEAIFCVFFVIRALKKLFSNNNGKLFSLFSIRKLKKKYLFLKNYFSEQFSRTATKICIQILPETSEKKISVE